MKILITGASGFMGSQLMKRLHERGNDVSGVTSTICDLTEQNAVYTKLSTEGDYDIIYHLAAWTRAGDFCLTHQGEQWLINQKINTNILSWWKEFQPQAKMICMGTSCSYDPTMALKETNYMKGVPIESLFSYAMTKRMLYAGLISLNKQYGLKYMYFVPSTLYGPTYHKDGRQMHFIFDLARKIVRGKMYDEKVVLWGNGHQKREIIHIDDFITAMTALSSRENDIINIGAGEEHSIRQFAQIICDKVGYDFDKIQFDKTKYVGAKSKCLNVSKMRNLLPGMITVPLEKGIGKMVDWVSVQEVNEVK